MKIVTAIAALALSATTALADPGAYLEITLQVSDENRPAAAAIYSNYKEPFLTTIEGAEQKSLLIRAEDVQVLHGFETVQQAQAYLTSDLFQDDIVGELGPLLSADPEVRIYQAN